MIPMALDPAAAAVAVAGRGARALARYRALREAGAAEAWLFCDIPSAEAATAAGPLLRTALPDAVALRGLRALWIADLPLPEAEALAASARAAGVLVNVEDVPHLCDFHNVAALRRGDLLITVSTGGRNPGLAALIRRRLDALFGTEWAERIEALSRKRHAWRAQGHEMQAVARLTEAALARKGWLA